MRLLALCPLFQSPYGGIGASDDDIIDDYKKISSFNHLAVAGVGLTGLPFLISHISESFMFQSPYGGRGRSDRISVDMIRYAVLSSFNHLTVAGVGLTI